MGVFVNGRRWGFEEGEDEAFAESAPQALSEGVAQGQDPGGTVTVDVGGDGGVLGVSLARGWREQVGPHGLGAAVQAAVNSGVTEAMRLRATAGAVAAGVAAAETKPLSIAEGRRLAEAVFADVERFSRQLGAVAGRTATLTSAGGHVSGSARRGVVVELSVDARWAGQVRESEVEGELREVLARLVAAASVGDLAAGPRSAAIDELTALTADPQLLLRRLGLSREGKR
ncbi:hypothetical protein ACOBQX_28795 [Actinokineospora sp. G85]|uniref:hypothetical protein n=1 Tax=Actinokineospora sp. G85 TaxID=3406626 RepID=UPI003C774245